MRVHRRTRFALACFLALEACTPPASPAIQPEIKRVDPTSAAGYQSLSVHALPLPPADTSFAVGKGLSRLWLVAEGSSVRVVFAYNNACEYSIAAGFRRHADVIDISFFDPRPKPDPSKPPYIGLLCPAQINVEWYEVVVGPVSSGRYVVNVFGSPDTTYWKPQYATVHGTILLP